MPKVGNNAEKAAARRVQKILDVPYTKALNLVRKAKTEKNHWGHAADRVLTEQQPGLFE